MEARGSRTSIKIGPRRSKVPAAAQLLHSLGSNTKDDAVQTQPPLLNGLVVSHAATAASTLSAP